jgi:hypothetical protein
MSHITQVKTDIKDIEALTAAAAALGLVVQRDAVPRYFATSWGGTESIRCEYMIQLPGKYDLGFKMQDDGSYKLVCDNELLSGGYGANDPGRKLLGDNIENLRHHYTVERTRLMARKRGLALQQVGERRADGSVVLRISS